HRFYTGKIKSGVVQLVTLGGCGVWALVDLITILLGKFKDKNGVPMSNVNPKVTWASAVVVTVIGLAVLGGAQTAPSGSSSSGASTSSPGNSGKSVNSDPQESIRKKYAGVYKTTSGPLTFAGGLGLFESGNYSLMFGQSGTKRSRAW